jgi:hypothetical protein
VARLNGRDDPGSGSPMKVIKGCSKVLGVQKPKIQEWAGKLPDDNLVIIEMIADPKPMKSGARLDRQRPMVAPNARRPKPIVAFDLYEMQ